MLTALYDLHIERLGKDIIDIFYYRLITMAVAITTLSLKVQGCDIITLITSVAQQPPATVDCPGSKLRII